MVKFCWKCQEYSIATKRYTRKKDNMKMVHEFCMNKNPMCQYRQTRELGYDEEKAKDNTQKEVQLEFDFGTSSK